MLRSVRKNESLDQAAAARFFSAAVFHELLKSGRSAIFARLVKDQGLDIAHSTSNVSQVFEYAFSLLKRKVYRNEYVYKTAIAQKVLLGAHSLKTASMIGEFRVGGNKADLVILNGTSKAYEIKSERDKLDRLAAQVVTYSQVFSSVEVLCAEKHLPDVLAVVPDFVGVSVLTDRFQISNFRKSIEEPGRTQPASILDAMTRREAVMVLKRLGIEAPDVPNTQMYAALKSIFESLPSEQIHKQMVHVLKNTRNLSRLVEAVDGLPASLTLYALTVPFGQRGRENLFSAMDTPVLEAIKWG
ncbi:sce7726 family protein [Pseudomonas sp. NyZ704]|nr:sce7726 family protein [Pseudomonas sp. NyZ704]